MKIWKSIPNYDELYKVSNTGQVKRIKPKEKILKCPIGKRGYPIVSLCKQGIVEKRPVHIFMMRTFVGIPQKGYQVNHKDGNKENNYLSNLEYVTSRENVLHAIKMGLRTYATGSDVPYAKLTNEKVIAIREEFAKGGILKKQLAQKYSIDASHIGRIINGRFWRHLIKHHGQTSLVQEIVSALLADK